MTTWKTSRGNLSNRKRKMEKKHHRQQEHHRPQSKQCIERVVRVFVVFFYHIVVGDPWKWLGSIDAEHNGRCKTETNCENRKYAINYRESDENSRKQYYTTYTRPQSYFQFPENSDTLKNYFSSINSMR